VRSLDGRVTRRLALALVACWAVLGALLARFTDTDVPWFDAAPTTGSVFAQVLLARKFVQAWALWIGVNLIAVALFASKSLWLTALLYLIFVVLSVAGWRRWRRLAQLP
jgi:nicotinamide mononucleotide transporter